MFVDIIKVFILLATDNDQQSYQRLTRFGAFWTFCAFYVN